MKLHELLKKFKEEDYLTVKTTAVQYLINSGRMDQDASAAAWCLAVVDRLKYYLDKHAEANFAKVNKTVEEHDGDPFDPW